MFYTKEEYEQLLKLYNTYVMLAKSFDCDSIYKVKAERLAEKLMLINAQKKVA